MAENKKSFVLYADLINTVRKMPKGKQAELFITILEYVNDENPVVEDLIVSLVWEPIKLQLKRDLVKYEKFRSKQSENGKKGGRPPIENETQNNPNNPSLYLETQKSLTVTDICNNVSNVSESKEEKITPTDLSNSNLYRQPTIPEYENVLRVFMQKGGTKEMAERFYEGNNATGWYLKGSPIVNFSNLVGSYIQNWQKFETPVKKLYAGFSYEPWMEGLSESQVKMRKSI